MKILLQSSLFLLLFLNSNIVASKDWIEDARDVKVSIAYYEQSFKINRFESSIIEFAPRPEDVPTAPVKAQLQTSRGNKPTLVIFNDERSPEDAKINFLNWNKNIATFMQLNHLKWGDWFVTPPLSGCDAWIAVAEGLEPVVLHINANGVKMKVENLQHKELLAEKIKQTIGSRYMFALRISSDFKQKDKYLSVEDKDNIDNYWKKFSHSNTASTFLYLPTKVFLYGERRHTGILQEKWIFTLKDLETGQKLLTLDCPTMKNTCDIHRSGRGGN